MQIIASLDQILVYNHALLLFSQYASNAAKVLLFMADVDEFLVPQVNLPTRVYMYFLTQADGLSCIMHVFNFVLLASYVRP